MNGWFGTVTVLSGTRSEEHTSELQSQSNLVCRLLLEKKNDAEITGVRKEACDPRSDLTRSASRVEDARALGRRMPPEDGRLLRPDRLHLRRQVADHRFVRHFPCLWAARVHARELNLGSPRSLMLVLSVAERPSSPRLAPRRPPARGSRRASAPARPRTGPRESAARRSGRVGSCRRRFASRTRR